MKEIRIEKVYDDSKCGQTFIILKQTEKGKVIYTEDFYPSKNSCKPIKSDPRIISAHKANEIFVELKQYAVPYIRYTDNGLFNPMK